jgi:hypothetical protein
MPPDDIQMTSVLDDTRMTSVSDVVSIGVGVVGVLPGAGGSSSASGVGHVVAINPNAGTFTVSTRALSSSQRAKNV